jgi:hypothetical protein
MAERKQTKLRYDDFIANVQPDPAKPAATTMLSGFVGRGPEGHARIYPDPSLSSWYDVPEDGIVHSMPIADSKLGGSHIWVNADAQIKPGSAAAAAATEAAAQPAITLQPTPATHCFICPPHVTPATVCTLHPTPAGFLCPPLTPATICTCPPPTGAPTLCAVPQTLPCTLLCQADARVAGAAALPHTAATVCTQFGCPPHTVVPSVWCTWVGCAPHGPVGGPAQTPSFWCTAVGCGPTHFNCSQLCAVGGPGLPHTAATVCTQFGCPGLPHTAATVCTQFGCPGPFTPATVCPTVRCGVFNPFGG